MAEVKLTPVQVDEIVRDYQGGETAINLGKKYGVSGQLVRNKLKAAGVYVDKRGKKAPIPPITAKRLAKADYEMAKAMLESNEYTLGEVCSAYNVTVVSMKARLKADGYRFNQDGTKAVVVENTAGRVIEAESKSKKAPLTKTKEELVAFEQQTKNDYTIWLDQVSKQSLLLIAKANKQGIPLGNLKDDFRALESVSSILTKNQKAIADMNGFGSNVLEDELPVFTIHEMTAEDVEDIRRKQREDRELLLGGISKGDEDNEICEEV